MLTGSTFVDQPVVNGGLAAPAAGPSRAAYRLGSWSAPEVVSLNSAMKSLHPGGGEIDEKLIDWARVSEIVSSRSAKQCRQVHV